MKFKEFEVTSSSYLCNKNCPFCTAKITKWPKVFEDFNLIEKKLKYLKDNGITFRYFIFSGNGEPSLIPFEKFKTVIEATRKVNIFDEKRIQTSGNLFYETDKFNLIKDDFIIEITRVSLNPEEDMRILGYKENYLESDNFKEGSVRLNYVLMKNKSFNDYLEEIKEYIDRYPNIKTVSLKTLNLNTMSGDVDNEYSKWIIEHALTKNDTDKIIEYMNSNTKFLCSDNKFFDRYEWIYEGIPITFYAKKLDYGYSNIVFYGNELVDYKLNKFKLPQVEKKGKNDKIDAEG